MHMKKAAFLLLTMIFLLSLCACGNNAASSAGPAPAAEAEPEAIEKPAEEAPADAEPEPMPPYEAFETPFGFKVEFPEEYQNLKGELAWWNTAFGYTEVHMELYYVEVPDGEREAFREEAALAAKNIDGWVPDWAMQYRNIPLFSVVGLYDDDASIKYYETVSPAQYIKDNYEIPEGGGSTSIPVYQGTVSLENGWKLIAQRNQVYTFEGEALPLTAESGYLDEGYREEAVLLLENPELFISALKEIPWKLPGQVGSQVSFEARTLQGDTVTSEDILSGHKVTMVYIWATWCGPCVGDLEKLEKLNSDFAEKDSQIIGICLDATHGDQIEEALRILEENGVTYPNLTGSMDLVWANTRSFPMALFLSEDGTILTEPIVRANVLAYTSMLNQTLALVG